jgi:prevent-host-death family protein
MRGVAGGARRPGQNCHHGLVVTIPQKELRNNVAEVLRRAQAGERFTITVAGRPVAELGPTRSRQWVPSAQLAYLWALPADGTLGRDLELLGGELHDPWPA